MFRDLDRHQRQNDKQPNGRDELNLIDFPIGTLSFKQPVSHEGHRPEQLEFSVDSYDPDVGKTVPKKLTIRTSSQFGFPTPKEEELLVGLLLLTRLKNNFEQPRVEFRSCEIFRLMNWPHNGSSKRQLKNGLDRLSGVNLRYENSWTANDGKSFEKIFHTGILDSYQLVTAASSADGKGRSWFQWSSEVFTDIRSGNVKELNTSEFFRLRRPLSRRMYRFLDKHLGKSAKLEMDLKTFAAHLGLSELRHVGKIKERLRPAVEELSKVPGFFVPLEWAERFRRQSVGQWSVVFERSKNPAEATPRHKPAASPNGKLVCSFYEQWSERSDHRPTSRELYQVAELVQKYGAERLSEMLPIVIRLMKSDFPDAKAFGATMHFWPEADKQLKRRFYQVRRDQESHREEKSHNEERKVQRLRKERLRVAWKQLSKTEQAGIRQSVYQSANTFVQTRLEQRRFDDPLVELACLDELERRQSRSSNQAC